MGRKRKQLTIDTSAKVFHDLDVEYTVNDYNNAMVDALNSLPPDERSMMILYVATGCNKSKLAKMLGCSRTHIHPRIVALQTKLKEIIKTKKNADDDLY